MRHAFVSPKSAASDTTIIDGPKWNDGHVEPVTVKSGSYVFANSDAGAFYVWNDAADRVLTFPQTLTDSGWTVTIKNLSTTNKLTITPTSVTIDGQSTLDIPARSIAKVIFDGTNYRTGLTAAAGVLPANYVMASDPSSSGGMLRPRLLTASDIPTALLMASEGSAPLLPSAKVDTYWIASALVANSDNDLYTVPSGKRAVLFGTLMNQTGSTLTLNTRFKVGGTYYNVGASVNVSLTNNNSVNLTPWNQFPIAEAGDIISFNLSGSSSSGLTFFGGVILFNNTEPVKSPRLLGVASGDQTLYTCPSGKVAFLSNFSMAGNAPIRFINTSGGSLTIKWNFVPSGGSPSSSNLLVLSTAVSNNAVSNVVNGLGFLKAGDFVNLNCSGASASGAAAYLLNVVEIPA